VRWYAQRVNTSNTANEKKNRRPCFVVTQLDCASTLVILFLLSKKKKESAMQSNQENLNLQSKGSVNVRPKNLQVRPM